MTPEQIYIERGSNLYYMKHGNARVTLPRDPGLKIPETKAQFDALSYKERVQLQEEHPDVYRVFTKSRTWE